MNNPSKRDKEKQANERKILNAAEKVFCAKGYDAASMDEISGEAQFTKRTVYQYFESKEDLYSAVVLGALGKLMSRIRGIHKFETTGYDKLERFCTVYDKFYRENPHLIRLIEHWGRFKDNPAASGRNKEELNRTSREMTRNIADMIDEGKQDGSIQQGLDTEKSAICLKLMIAGLYNQHAVAGENPDSEETAIAEELSTYALELLIRPLKRIKAATATRKGTA